MKSLERLEEQALNWTSRNNAQKRGCRNTVLGGKLQSLSLLGNSLSNQAATITAS